MKIFWIVKNHRGKLKSNALKLASTSWSKNYFLGGLGGLPGAGAGGIEALSPTAETVLEDPARGGSVAGKVDKLGDGEAAGTEGAKAKGCDKPAGNDRAEGAEGVGSVDLELSDKEVAGSDGFTGLRTGVADAERFSDGLTGVAAGSDGFGDGVAKVA